MKANWLSNGLGGQSMRLLQLAVKRRIPATVSITADTGSEIDRVCSTGERMTNQQFFDRYVKPYAEANGIEALFIRALDEDKKPMPPIIEVLRSARGDTFEGISQGISQGISVPLFTNDKSKGRLKQSCTDKWKVRAIHQEARRRGVTELRSAIGLHAGEVDRIKPRYLFDDGDFSIFKPQTKRNGAWVDIKWLQTYYPLIDLKENRLTCQAELAKDDLAFLFTSECDCCPHQDYARWSAHTPEVIDELAEIEAGWNGILFLTPERIPLKLAIEEMRLKELDKKRQGSFVDFGCESGGMCGV